MEWIFHLMTSITALGLVFITILNNVLTPWVPFTWPFFIWMAFFGWLLIDYVVMFLDQPPLSYQLRKSSTPMKFILIIFILTGLVLIGLNGLAYPTTFWIVSVIFHCIMIPISLQPQYTNQEALINGPAGVDSFQVKLTDSEVLKVKVLRNFRITKFDSCLIFNSAICVGMVSSSVRVQYGINGCIILFPFNECLLKYSLLAGDFGGIIMFLERSHVI
jgi:hypothetical protein